MDETVNTFFELNKRTKISDIADAAVNLGADRITKVDRRPGVFLELLHAEADAAFNGVNAQDLDLNFITAIEHTLRALSTA